MPLHLVIKLRILAAERLHGDDTTWLALAKNMTDTGRTSLRGDN
jgi:hypothetical protein